MPPEISVIICAHNPRYDYLDKVISALKAQTLSMESWELLLVDNASSTNLQSIIDLGWHSNARHIREEQLGLTAARLRGIKEASGEVLVFVDDDNVLDGDYLEVALQITKKWPVLGAWGGRIEPGFEIAPPEWAKPHWDLLAIRQFDHDRWSNAHSNNHALPCGAGLCIRNYVAQRYVALVQQDIQRSNLDRIGASLSSCGDSDLALTACDLGLGTGMFVALKLTHLIPENRLREDYLLKLVEGISYSSSILKFLREGAVPYKKSRSDKFFEVYRLAHLPKRETRFHQARERGTAAALQKIISLQSNVL